MRDGSFGEVVFMTDSLSCAEMYDAAEVLLDSGTGRDVVSACPYRLQGLVKIQLLVCLI